MQQCNGSWEGWHATDHAGTDLLEHAILVADAVAPAGQVEGGHGIDEAGGQPAQAAVAESGVLLCIHQGLHVVAQLLEGLAVDPLQLQVHHRVQQRAAHQELGAQVVDELRVLLAAAMKELPI